MCGGGGAIGTRFFMRIAYKLGHCFQCGVYAYLSQECPKMHPAGHVITTPQSC